MILKYIFNEILPIVDNLLWRKWNPSTGVILIRVNFNIHNNETPRFLDTKGFGEKQRRHTQSHRNRLCLLLYIHIHRYPSGSSAPAYNSRVYNGNQLRWQTVQTRRNLEISRNIVHRLRFKRCLLSYTSNVRGKGRCRTRVGRNTIVHLINNTFIVVTKFEKEYIEDDIDLSMRGTIVKWRKNKIQEGTREDWDKKNWRN